jgi:hypothetical protein
MSSLRASATIMVLRAPGRAFSVRALYHRARPLSFWNMRNRQASWIRPRRTRALPALARPFSRRRLPLSSGEPVMPRVAGDSSSIPHAPRQDFVHEHIRRLNADPDHACQQAHHRVCSFLWSLCKALQTCFLNLLHLVHNEA